MIKSMTGFGRGEASDGVRTVTVEIRAVNHRYGEFTVKAPRRYAFVEEAVKKLARAEMRRGKAEISINAMSVAEEESAVFVNSAAAKQYFKGLRELQSSFDVCGDITLELLASLPDVMKSAPSDLDEESIIRVVSSATTNALRTFNDMRASEGAALASDLIARANLIDDLLQKIDARAPELPALYAERLRDRIAELMNAGAPDLPQERLAQEVAIFADRSNITEEIVRLRSHIAQLRRILNEDAGGPAGKKLDFLVQEMNREANTIGSKANDLKITECMLDMKSEIEKIREQVQNIE
ncbi:MAG: YicC family protein [Clostridiales Family XIII bacterium]|jgi:uncharacterized protein (TIGR00255 family)|nr:YicC family protein [Clostridiales Family XIII bacterium]